VLDATWLRDVQDIEHTKFQKRKVVVRDQGRLMLNTMGKLIEKCISNHIQFDCVKHGVFQSNQFGGIMQ
jgi:hypothetical protein